MATTYWRHPEFWPGKGDGVSRGESLREAAPEIPVGNLLIAYVLLLPLIFIAVHGAFSFEHASLNSDLGAHGGRIAIVSSTAETLRDTLQSWIALMLCLAPMVPYARSIVASAKRMPVMLTLPLYAIASALWSQDAGLSLRSGIFLLVMTIFALYLTTRFSHRQQMELVMLTGACVAVSSVVLALMWPQFGLDGQLHDGAWQGLFTQKNICAQAILFLLTPAFALPSVGRYGQLLRAIYIVLCMLLILLSRSRTDGR